MFRKCRASKGVAAIEFALLLVLLVIVLSSLFAYSMLLQTQQSVTRATGDGARLLQHLIHKGLDTDDLELKVIAAVQRGIEAAGLANSESTEVIFTWSTTQVQVVVHYPNPISQHLWAELPVMRSLEAQAIVAL